MDQTRLNTKDRLNRLLTIDFYGGMNKPNAKNRRKKSETLLQQHEKRHEMNTFTALPSSLSKESMSEQQEFSSIIRNTVVKETV